MSALVPELRHSRRLEPVIHAPFHPSLYQHNHTPSPPPPLAASPDLGASSPAAMTAPRPWSPPTNPSSLPMSPYSKRRLRPSVCLRDIDAPLCVATASHPRRPTRVARTRSPGRPRPEHARPPGGKPSAQRRPRITWIPVASASARPAEGYDDEEDPCWGRSLCLRTGRLCPTSSALTPDFSMSASTSGARHAHRLGGGPRCSLYLCCSTLGGRLHRHGGSRAPARHRWSSELPIFL